MQPEYVSTVDHYNGSNTDIIKTVEKRFPKAVQQTKEFAQQFKGSNANQTAYNVWKFLKNHITYVKDDEQKQIIRLPSWFLHTSEGDCKSYSLFAASILANLGLPVSFRYASYNPYNRTPSHVYTVVNDENGKEIIVDGVWKYFNDQKPPAYQYTHPMEVISMSGIADEIAGIGDDVAGIGKHGGALSFAKKIALAPNRRAFRTIVSLNLFGLARKLAKLYKKNPKAFAKLWTRLGGKPSELLKSVKKGYNHWAKHHKKIKMNGVECCVAGTDYYDQQRHLVNNLTGIGALPALAAVIAAASPVVGAFAAAIKKNGADKTEPGEPPMDEAVRTSSSIRQNTPGAESTVNGLTNGMAIGELRIGDLAIGKRKGKLKQRINKIRLAPARRAFRTLIAVNAGGMAYKMKRASIKDAAALKSKWEKMGGKYSELLKSINAGFKRVPAKKRAALQQRKPGAPSSTNIHTVAGIGDDSKATGIAALAATIIKAFSGLFKKHDKNSDGTSSPGETTFQKIVDVAEVAADKIGLTKQPADDLVEQGKADTEGSDAPSTAGFTASPLLLIGGVGAALLLFRKHK